MTSRLESTEGPDNAKAGIDAANAAAHNAEVLRLRFEFVISRFIGIKIQRATELPW
jgi:hypothetical protein